MRPVIGTGLKLLAFAIAFVAGAFTVFLISYDVLEVRPYLPQVQAIIHNGPADDIAVPELVGNAVRKVEPHWHGWAVAQLTGDLGMPDGPAGHYVLRQVLWASLLRVHLSETDRLALYAHMMWFEEGRGLSYGSHKYFGKAPHDLSTDEVIDLLAIERAPRSNDPVRHPDRYAAAKAQLTEAYTSK